MKILHISDVAPGRRSGGALAVMQSSLALLEISSDVDYAGAEVDDSTNLYEKVSICNYSKLANYKECLYSILNLEFNKRFINWKKANIDCSNYDLIFIDKTIDRFLIKSIRKTYNGKIIVRAHNVEYDYLKNETILAEKYRFRRFLNFLTIFYRERYIIKHVDLIIAITEADVNRFTSLYHVNKKKIRVVPVGVENVEPSQITLTFPVETKIRCLFTGGLDYSPNVQGILWFINKVYSIVKDVCEVTVAGKNPCKKVVDACNKFNIHLVDSPKDMKPYYDKSDLVIVPTFLGAGMKVKVAQAMAYGKPIVTTSHGVIGYEKGLKDGINCFIKDTPEGFAEAILTYKEMSDESKRQFLESEREAYEKYYSLNVVTNQMKDIILEELISGNRYE